MVRNPSHAGLPCQNGTGWINYRTALVISIFIYNFIYILSVGKLPAAAGSFYHSHIFVGFVLQKAKDWLFEHIFTHYATFAFLALFEGRWSQCKRE